MSLPSEPPHNSFGDALKWWLDHRLVSPPDLARKMRVDRTLPAHWLANRKAPSLEDLVEMFGALVVPERSQGPLMRLAAEERGRIKARRRTERAQAVAPHAAVG